MVSSLNALMKGHSTDLKNRGRKLESDDTWRQKKKKHGELELYFSDANLALFMLSTISRLLTPKRSYLARKE